MSAAGITWAESNRRIAAVICGAVAIGILPLYAAELNVMAHMSMYQFFPFVFAFVSFVGWRRWRAAEETLGPRAGKGWWPETLCVVAALGLLAVHAGLFGPWLGGAAGTMAAAAGVLALQRLRDVRLWDLWALLVITMRLPLELDGRLASYLQWASSQMSSMILDTLGVLHVLLGNVVTLPQRELFVDEACSGIISVMSVIACAAMLAIWRERRTLHLVLLILFGVASAMIMNVVRITTIAAALAWYDVDWTSGWQHETISLASFLATFVLLAGFDVCVVALTAPIAAGDAESLGWKSSRLVIRGWNWLAKWDLFRSGSVDEDDDEAESAIAPARFVRPPRVRFAVLAVIAVALGAFHSVALYAHFLSATADTDHVVQQVVDAERSAVARAIAPWRVVDEQFEERDTISELGRFSKVYRVEHPETGTTATLSFDFPFYRRWHDLCGCYLNSGWKEERKEVVRDGRPPRGNGCQYIRAAFQNESGSHAWLAFANINEDGILVAPPEKLSNFGYLINTLIVKAQHARQISLNPRKLFQVQVWHTQAGVHSAEKQAELESLFFQAYDYLAAELRSE